MEIPTTAAGLGLSIVALEGIDPATLEPAKKFKSDDPVLVDGKPVYRLPDLYTKDGSYRATVSIKILEKPKQAVSELKHIRLVGAVIVKPYVANNGRIAYSITATSVEEVAE